MDKKSRQPRYKIGDLVRCWYTFYFYQYYKYDDLEDEPVYGIVIDIDYAEYDEELFDDIIYVVFCMDGIYRFFVEEEVYKVS